MSQGAQSMWLAPAALYPLLLAALLLTAARSPRAADLNARRKLVEVFLIGIAFQCIHMLEEFLTGLHILYPALFGLAPVPGEFFVTLNVVWIGIWALSAFGVLRGFRAAYFPLWFFALAMCLNGIVHPLLSLWVGGYFPGLVTSPVAGIIGVVLTRKLFQVTEPAWLPTESSSGAQ